jgi:hypothetical protein
MTVDKSVHSQSRWVVRLTAPEQMGGGASEPDIWDVAMSDPDEAVKRVCELIRVSGERAEAVQELSAASIRSFGLNKPSRGCDGSTQKTVPDVN